MVLPPNLTPSLWWNRRMSNLAAEYTNGPGNPDAGISYATCAGFSVLIMYQCHNFLKGWSRSLFLVIDDVLPFWCENRGQKMKGRTTTNNMPQRNLSSHEAFVEPTASLLYVICTSQICYGVYGPRRGG